MGVALNHPSFSTIFLLKIVVSTALTWRYHLKNSGRDLGQLAALASALQSPGTTSGAVGSRVERGVPWFMGSEDLRFFSDDFRLFLVEPTTVMFFFFAAKSSKFGK